MSLVLCAVENRSDHKSTAFLAWVFEGTARVGAVLGHLVLSEITNFGYNYRLDNYETNEEFLESHAMNLSISKIRKYNDFREMPKGFTALFEVAGEEGELSRFRDLLQGKLIPILRPKESANKANPKIYHSIYLFNDRGGADRYFMEQKRSGAL
ncbi:hypothetical protein ACFFLM_16895 [Deinococcus oregonensis]|uniref:Uncharacterized protein n=1 Tax=Deinococcus oregonensis TaxID=1805970 RepID=A0ABV6B1K4_9DEIO